MTQDTAASIGGKGRYRRWLLAAGMLISAVSAVCLVQYAIAHQGELRSTQIRPDGAGWLVAAAILYASALLVIAVGWLAAVRACRDNTSARRVIGIALVSQIGKYVPGNVAQHIGKAMYGGSHGMILGVVAKSTLFEIASIATAGGLVAFVSGSTSPLFARLPHQFLSLLISHWRLAALTAVALCAVSLIVLVSRIASLRRVLTFAPVPAMATLGLHVISITLLGLSFYAVARAFTGGLGINFCVALFSTAWLLGFLTPGAPAGLGVRETILVIGLSGALGPMALPAAILHRLISALTDGAMALIGVLLLKTDRSSISAGPEPRAHARAKS